MSTPPKKNYEQIAAAMALDAMIASALGSSNGGSLDFLGTPSAEALRKADEEAAVKAAQETELAKGMSKEEALNARIRMMERKIAKTEKKIAKKARKAGSA